MNWILLAIGLIVGLVISYFVAEWRISNITAAAATTLTKQIADDHQLCNSAQNVTTNADKKYENLYNAAQSELDKLRAQPTTCVPVYIKRPARVAHAANQPVKPDKPNGVTSTALYDFAGECETDRIKVITCQQFITDERKINKQ